MTFGQDVTLTKLYYPLINYMYNKYREEILQNNLGSYYYHYFKYHFAICNPVSGSQKWPVTGCNYSVHFQWDCQAAVNTWHWIIKIGNILFKLRFLYFADNTETWYNHCVSREKANIVNLLSQQKSQHFLNHLLHESFHLGNNKPTIT